MKKVITCPHCGSADMHYEAGGYIQIDVPPIEVNFSEMDIAPKPELNHPDNVFQSDWDNFKAGLLGRPEIKN